MLHKSRSIFGGRGGIILLKVLALGRQQRDNNSTSGFPIDYGLPKRCALYGTITVRQVLILLISKAVVYLRPPRMAPRQIFLSNFGRKPLRALS